MWRILVQVCQAVLIAGVLIAAQTTDMANPPATAQPAPKPQFFAGTVTDVTAQQIVVSRNPVGGPAVVRTFSIDTNTKMNRDALKPKVRVTVRYVHQADGDLALEIQVRPTSRSARPL